MRTGSPTCRLRDVSVAPTPVVIDYYGQGAVVGGADGTVHYWSSLSLVAFVRAVAGGAGLGGGLDGDFGGEGFGAERYVLFPRDGRGCAGPGRNGRPAGF